MSVYHYHERMYERTLRCMALPMNMRAHRAAVALEDRGYRFCVDFGYENAEDIADFRAPGWDYDGEKEGAD